MKASSKVSRGFSTAIAAVAVLPLVLAVLLASISFFASFQPFYEYEYVKHGIHEATGMSGQSLSNVTREVINYLMGRPSDMLINEAVHGTVRQIFNEKELGHMVDVVILFDLLRAVLLGCGISALALFAASVFAAKKGERAYAVSRGVLWVSAPLLGLIIAATVYMILNFNSVFLQFHYIFFAGDAEVKWLLDPSRDILIQMVPEGFFIDIAIGIFSAFMAVLAVFVITSAIVFAKSRRRLIVQENIGDECGAITVQVGRKYYSEEATVENTSQADVFGEYVPAETEEVLEVEESVEFVGDDVTTIMPEPVIDDAGVEATKASENVINRPTAEEIFESMGIKDNRHVPTTVLDLVDDAKREFDRRKKAPASSGKATASEIFDRLNKL